MWGCCSRSAQTKQAAAASNHFHLHTLVWPHLLPPLPPPTHGQLPQPRLLKSIKAWTTIKVVIVNLEWASVAGWACGMAMWATGTCRHSPTPEAGSVLGSLTRCPSCRPGDSAVQHSTPGTALSTPPEQRTVLLLHRHRLQMATQA